MSLLRRSFLFSILSLLAAPLWATTLPQPEGTVLITVSGSINADNGDGVVQFDRTMLENLDWREVRTYTSFTSGEQVFEGPTLASLLTAVGADGDTLKAIAINDYTVTIPAAHASEHGVILAMDQNGRAMRVRDKGPIWVVYPLDETQAGQQLFDAEMIWQLNRIVVE